MYSDRAGCFHRFCWRVASDASASGGFSRRALHSRTSASVASGVSGALASWNAGRGAVPTVVTGDGADAASGFGSDGEADVVLDGEDEAGEVYFTRRGIVPRVADERHWTTPPRRAPNALQVARASPPRPGTPRPGSTPPAAALPSMVLPPPATQSTSGQQ